MKDLQGYLKDSEVIAFFGAIKNARDYLLFRLLYKTGRRVSEILCLKVNDIEWEEGLVCWHILKKKDKEYTAVKLIDKKTLNILEGYINTNRLGKDDYLFQAERRKIWNNKRQPSKIINPHLSRYTVYYLTKKYCKKIGIEKVGNKLPHPHIFRHTFAVRMAKRMKFVGDIRKLQKMLEHTDMGITETYLQFNQEDMRELIEAEDII